MFLALLSTVTATNLDIRDLSHAQDSIKLGDGTDFLEINPDGSLNVKVIDYSPGNGVSDFNSGAAVPQPPLVLTLIPQLAISIWSKYSLLLLLN
jgi:hypothetical protein